ncbi:MAG: hypothetical protein R2854_18730 [Caldilineaceae bacterium]
MPVYRSVEAGYVNTVDGFIFNSETTRNRGAPAECAQAGIVVYPAADHIAARRRHRATLIAALGRDEGRCA